MPAFIFSLVCVCGDFRGEKRPSDPLELEFQVVLSDPMQMLGAALGPLGAAHIRTHSYLLSPC